MGEREFTWGPWGEPRHQAGESTLGFQSDPTDPLTGLVDMGARDYHPALGRFTTRDPLFGETTEPMTLNQFLYAWGDPVTLDDPTGLDPAIYWGSGSRRTNYQRLQRARARAARRAAARAVSRSRGARGGATSYRPNPHRPGSILRGGKHPPPLPRRAPSPGSGAALSRTVKSRDFHGNEFRRASLAATGVSRMGLGGNPVELFKKVGRAFKGGWDFAWRGVKWLGRTTAAFGSGFVKGFTPVASRFREAAAIGAGAGFAVCPPPAKPACAAKGAAIGGVGGILAGVRWGVWKGVRGVRDAGITF